MQVTLIYPNQLFHHHPGLSKKRKVFLIEEPLFFCDPENQIFSHKKKILLHLLSIEQYQISLKNRGYQVSIIKKESLVNPSDFGQFLQQYGVDSVAICRTTDLRLEKKIYNAAKKYNITINWHDSPGFLLENTLIQEEFPEGKRYFMAPFYKNQRRRFNLLLDHSGNPMGGKWSFDEANRKKLPKKIDIPRIKTQRRQLESPWVFV